MAVNIDKSEILTVWDYDIYYNLLGPHVLTSTDRSPISGKWQLPARSTTQEPPEEKEGYKIVFDPKSRSWDYKDISIPDKKNNKNYDDRSLDDIKKDKIKNLKHYREIHENDPILYKNHHFDFDVKSRERLSILEKAFPGLEISTISWNDSDDESVDLTREDIQMIFVLAALRMEEQYKTYKELNFKVQKAATEEEVVAIKWP